MAALCFYWPALERQITIEGAVKVLDPQLSDEYFQSRPKEAQVGAWVSRQSEPLVSRDVLEQEVEEFIKKMSKNP